MNIYKSFYFKLNSDLFFYSSKIPKYFSITFTVFVNISYKYSWEPYKQSFLIL